MTVISTHFLLMGQYNCQAVIPLEDVVRDYFSHLTVDSFLRKIGTGEIVIPVVRADTSQKSKKAFTLLIWQNIWIRQGQRLLKK